MSTMGRDGSVYLFRHGEAMNNVQPDIIFGRGENVPLTDLGFEQSHQLGQILKSKGIIPDVVYSSGATRAHQTGESAMRALGLQIDIIKDDRLHEQHTGDWTGRVAKDIFTEETITQIEAAGKDFRSPNGESMNDVGGRMLNWLEDVGSVNAAKARTLFAFTHGGAIRSLLSYLGGWSHAETYETRPPNTSVTVLNKVDGLWMPGQVGMDPNKLDPVMLVPSEISFRLSENEKIKEHLESVIWFGSMRNQQDIHKESDYDVQIVLDEPSVELAGSISEILRDYPAVDLSIMYMKDIYDHNGNVIFHDGTKGIFFMYVLASGKVLYGRNVYKDAVSRLTLEDVKPSIEPTIREYLSRLRVMAIQSPGNTRQFKKYSLKLFKDLLVHSGTIPLEEMATIDNESARKVIELDNSFTKSAKEALERITDLESNYTDLEMASLLMEYEKMVEGMCNE